MHHQTQEDQIGALIEEYIDHMSPKTSNFKNSYYLATHEAGHATMALHLKKPVLNITINPRTYSGETQYLAPTDPTAQDAWEALLITLAGPIAQHLLTDTPYLDGSSTDMTKAQHIINTLHHIYHQGKSTQDLYAQAVLHARGIIEANTSTIETIRNQLLHTNNLHEQDIMKLLTQQNT